MNPVHPIEADSYRILASRIDLSRWAPGDRDVVARMVHATADESFATTALVGHEAVVSAVAALRDGGIFERLVARLRVAGLPEEDARAACSAAQRSLLAAERKATLALIRGEGYIDWQPGI